MPAMPESPALCRLSVAVVTCGSDLAQLRTTLQSLAAAVEQAHRLQCVGEARLVIVDQTCDRAYRGALDDLAAQGPAASALPVTRIDLPQNVGFGAAHNIAMSSGLGDWHLVLNPDVELAPDCLVAALRTLRAQPQAVALSPRVRGPDGRQEYLCKRYPTVLTLLLRGFAPAWLRRPFLRRLHHYEMRDVCAREEAATVDLISGCFMLLRSSALREVGGFDRGFFLYFEDFDLSLRLRAHGALRFEPTVRITHCGGYAARKGWRHIRWFVASAWRFFDRHGWRWI